MDRSKMINRCQEGLRNRGCEGAHRARHSLAWTPLAQTPTPGMRELDRSNSATPPVRVCHLRLHRLIKSNGDATRLPRELRLDRGAMQAKRRTPGLRGSERTAHGAPLFARPTRYANRLGRPRFADSTLCQREFEPAFPRHWIRNPRASAGDRTPPVAAARKLTH